MMDKIKGADIFRNIPYFTSASAHAQWVQVIDTSFNQMCAPARLTYFYGHALGFSMFIEAFGGIFLSF